MKYIMLVTGDERVWADAGPEERAGVYEKWGAFSALLQERGAGRGGEELAHSSTATTLRKSDGQVLITDGPYAETVEQISGYMIVEAADMAEAVEHLGGYPVSSVVLRRSRRG